MGNSSDFQSETKTLKKVAQILSLAFKRFRKIFSYKEVAFTFRLKEEVMELKSKVAGLKTDQLLLLFSLHSRR